MLQTRSNSDGSPNPPDPIAAQLEAIAAKLESMESLKEDIAVLKQQSASRDKSSGSGSRFEEGDSSNSRFNRKPYHKIDFPAFSGGDPRGWILKAEKYFRFYNTLDEEKVDVAAIHLEGDALDLYSWLSTEQEITYWDELTHALQKHFGPPEFQNPDEYLCSIKQTGSVHEYRQEFTRRSARITNWPDHCLLGVFLNGLKEELKADVRIHKPRTVYKAMSLALEFESKLNHTRLEKKISVTPLKPDSKPFTSTPQPFTNQPKYEAKTPTRITDSEKQARFLRGECFRCGDKYGPGHRCKTGTLKSFEVDEFSEEEPVSNTAKTESIQQGSAEISLNAILGNSKPTTMKVYGMLNSTEILILIDGGSTHNFISDILVNELKLSTQLVSPFGVQIGNGDIIRCSRVCRDLSLQISDLKIVQDFYPFSIGGADLVLGIQWLATLNTVQANWKDMFMIFTLDGRKYKLQGVDSGPQKSAEFQHISFESEIAAPIPDILQPLLTSFAPLFQEPSALPPFRNHYHSIPLIPNATPPNIRPYRYPHAQKTEIERQVEALLAAGLIQPSTSPFSSPVLLVKKKDDTWRMCVDYRALNKITIADKYPIPNIDELLDELYGAMVFSKIDLRSGYYQIRVNPPDIMKTAFRTHSGHYEFKVMPFGLTNAPSTFQSAMNDLFRPYLRRFVLVFFDDILVYSPTMDQHLLHLKTTLELLTSQRFFAKISKCRFGQDQVLFLGHIISSAGVQVDQEKVESVRSWPVPTNAREALITAPVLRLPDFSKPFTVECDASSDGLGAILIQEDHTIAYFSKGLSSNNQLKSAYDRELLALVSAVQKWSHYLLGRHFLIRTDHYTLKFLLEQRVTTIEQQRLLLKLMPYDFSIIFRSGKENRGADSLS
ncbi:hypothetical protein QVD17_34309 [Tagetes erecta]|uniref:RNA-directed DNA polymerase n=1 Tax=Tagetes erecta TaxID=13708 RepID=A0AAD8K1Z6_TARER|nr:hypothetical protein QVD17_34309 [Tagetes erecta]